MWGDFLLDRYIYAYAERLSREAPVPILKFERERYDLGGAGNTAKNITSLGGEAYAIGITGKDEKKKILKELLKKHRIEAKWLIEAEGETPEKIRVLAGAEKTKRQQVLRLDRGEFMAQGSRGKLKEILIKLIAHMDALIISDYGYGSTDGQILREVIMESKRKPWILIDSHHRLLEFPDALVATPNIPEIEYLAGKKLISLNDFVKEGRKILKRTSLKALYITLGNRGMLLLERRKKAFHLPIFGTTNIVDVTGAGDTVIAVIALALAAGGTHREAAALANVAGGLVVMKEGAATLTPNELQEGIKTWWRQKRKLTG